MEQKYFVLLVAVHVHILWTVTAKKAKISQKDCSPDKKAEDSQCSETTARIITCTKREEETNICKLFTHERKWSWRQ